MATSDHTPGVFEIPLSQGYWTWVDEIDADLTQWSWYAHFSHERVYARRSIRLNGKTYHIWMHKVIYCRAQNLLIPPEVIDHIDNNPLNNRRDNLRQATPTQNKWNSGTLQRFKEKGILKGAHYHKRDRCWTSSICVNGKFIHLGTFETMEQAHEAYCEAAKRYFGEFSRFS